jgi:hypothetical protein
MNARHPPRLARTLLQRCCGGRFHESLEGDLLEEFAAGRSSAWYWRQVACAIQQHLRNVARQQMVTFAAATLFFIFALWLIAPATYPVVGWARTLEPMRALVLLGWLAGIPFILGGMAGAAERRQRAGAILLGAALAYLTPVTLPFTTAVCDLCSHPAGAALPDSILLLTPFGSALLAGLGAWLVGRLHTTT